MPLTNSPNYAAKTDNKFQIYFFIFGANTRDSLWPHQQWLLGQSINAAASWILEQSGNESAAAAWPQLLQQPGNDYAAWP